MVKGGSYTISPTVSPADAREPPDYFLRTRNIFGHSRMIISPGMVKLFFVNSVTGGGTG
jgi:hypothetical protein